MNTAISEEGLRNHYGAEVGRTLLRAYGDDVKVRAHYRITEADRSCFGIGAERRAD